MSSNEIEPGQSFSLGTLESGDGLLMQKVIGRPNWEGIHLYSDRAGAIMELVRKDWLSVCGS